MVGIPDTSHLVVVAFSALTQGAAFDLRVEANGARAMRVVPVTVNGVAELHSRLPHIIREGFAARVWIVSPTTCMATLNTMRSILKDSRMREHTGEIRKALRHLHRDVEIIGEKAGKLETHLRQAGDDVAGVLTAATRAGKRADRLDNFDFEELAPEETNVVPLGQPKE